MTSPSRRVRSPRRSPFPPGLPLSYPLGLRSQHNRILPLRREKEAPSCGIGPFPPASWPENGPGRSIHPPPPRAFIMSRVFPCEPRLASRKRGLSERQVAGQLRVTVSAVQHRHSGLQRERPHSGDAPVGRRLHPRARLAAEVIVVNDGSTDSTAEVVRSLPPNAPEFG
jgi:hypothetical protein